MNAATTSTAVGGSGRAAGGRRGVEDKPLCWYNASLGPSPGLGSAMCEFTGATPAAPHTLTMGIQSAAFPIDKGGVYAWSAYVYTETDANEGAVYGMQFSVNQEGSHDAMPPVDYHRGSGQPMSRRSVGHWVEMTGTLLGSDFGNGTGYVLAWLDGNATGRFAIADVKILRLNSALVGVIRTNASDINVTSDDGVLRYQLGRDYTVENAPKPNMAKGADLFADYLSGTLSRFKLW